MNQWVGALVVMDLAGSLAGAEPAAAVADALTKLGAEGARTVVVNFARVRAIDGAALAALLDADAEMRGLGAEVRLCAVSRRVGPEPIVAKLASTFKLFDSVEQAIEGPIA